MGFKMISLSFHSALLIFLQGGLASARTSATSCWSSSPSCGSTATSPTTSSAATTPKRPKIFLLRSRPPRSLPCSTRRLAWWSLRARGSTSSRRPNSASTCQIKRTRGRSGSGLPPGQTSRGRCVWFLTCCSEGFGLLLVLLKPRLQGLTQGTGQTDRSCHLMLNFHCVTHS